MKGHYAVVGNPIEHSKSPQIHAMFAEQTGEQLSYGRLWAPQDNFAAVARAFFCGGGLGLNVTVPFKEEAWQFANKLSERAHFAEAVNTLRCDDDGLLWGDNTDGVGLYRDLHDNLGIAIEAQRVLILGAGGAARGILADILAGEPSEVVIANRTAHRADELAQRFEGVGSCGLDNIPGRQFDLIINTTAAGLQGSMPALADGLLRHGGACYDLVYSDTDTPFMEWARRHHAGQVADGLGMLVEQAAESFFLWRGVRPDTQPVIGALRG
ncbi:shikimate dehydrogenase [Halorhodospira halochloris]|uniref:shikimate dehydrogenase n=1 Tax=Halorhodospira halochloris TaxID=1052 RepID=UPI001EE78881|nr:shikimate dehydrogenase [Halorhodospira halochloris]MCG5547287.1 shikimate dehydrogenase [Halorhodospira halochloris]